MIIFMINVLQSSLPTSKIAVQCAFSPFIELSFDLDYLRGLQNDLYCREGSAVVNLYFTKNYTTNLELSVRI